MNKREIPLVNAVRRYSRIIAGMGGTFFHKYSQCGEKGRARYGILNVQGVTGDSGTCQPPGSPPEPGPPAHKGLGWREEKNNRAYTAFIGTGEMPQGLSSLGGPV